MDWIRGLQRAIDYMEAHVTESVDYDIIARQMNVSAFYFQRIFTMVCGFPPSEYIRCRRLTLAGSELLGGDVKIIDTALKYGYDSPEGFSRAFTRFHGVTPNTTKKGNVTLKSFSPLKITITLKGGKSMNYKIIEKEAFCVLEKVETHSVVTDENKYEISDFWDKAKADGTVQTLVNSLADGKKNLMGICYGDAADGGTFEYSIAAECNENCTIPAGYRMRNIVAGTWIVFECTGSMPDAIQQTWPRISTEFFPTADYEPTYELDIEDYPYGDTLSPDYNCFIWIPVKKK